MNTDKAYYIEFENIYQDIYNRFPEKIKYVKFPELNNKDYNKLISERGHQLSLLQHYELYTPLLDITSNPYKALLFMTNGQLEEPQLELYDVSKTLLFMKPIKNQLNTRIVAQEGAFLNYEMLLSMTKSNCTLLDELTTNKDYDLKIPRVILKIKYQKEETKKKYKEIEEEIGKKSENNEELKKIADEITRDTTPLLGDEKDLEDEEKLVYKDVLCHLRQKLWEFKYNEDDLFPDFADFLVNKMKIFIKKDF